MTLTVLLFTTTAAPPKIPAAFVGPRTSRLLCLLKNIRLAPCSAASTRHRSEEDRKHETDTVGVVTGKSGGGEVARLHDIVNEAKRHDVRPG